MNDDRGEIPVSTRPGARKPKERGAATGRGDRGASEVAALAARRAVARALDVIEETDARTIADQVEIAGVAAPTFHEAERAKLLRDRFVEDGLNGVDLDEAGNVVARIDGAVSDPPVVAAAHLDTVFDADVEITVREETGRLHAPGIADNARGLAALLALGRSIRAAGVRPRRPILLVATTGEEGEGDLAGVKHLFRENGTCRDAAAFIAIDGTGSRRIVNRAVGSRRLRVEVRGAGGHSWTDRGVANPGHAVGRAIAALANLASADGSDVSLGANRLGGGTSVNAVPEHAWFELDLRAESMAALSRIEAAARVGITAAVDAERVAARAAADALRLDVEVIGDRPTGETPPTHPLVQAAWSATTYVGQVPDLVASSTDANVPISLGVPAIAIGAGGEGGRTHTTAEWFSNENGPLGIQRALLIILAAAGIAG